MLFALLGLPRAAWTQPATLTIAISGSESATFAGNCTVMTDSASQTLRLGGTVPETYQLTASGVSCRIRQTGSGGSLTVELRRNGAVVSHSSISGGSGSLSITLQ